MQQTIEDIDKLLQTSVGKTIASVVYECHPYHVEGKDLVEFATVTITFTDDTRLELESWDTEQYCSGIEVHR